MVLECDITQPESIEIVELITAAFCCSSPYTGAIFCLFNAAEWNKVNIWTYGTTTELRIYVSRGNMKEFKRWSSTGRGKRDFHFLSTITKMLASFTVYAVSSLIGVKRLNMRCLYSWTICISLQAVYKPQIVQNAAQFFRLEALASREPGSTPYRNNASRNNTRY